jgi:transcription antitermination factor NusG
MLVPNGQWLVITTQSHRERLACENCTAQDFTVYQPRILHKVRKPLTRFIPLSLFPGYLFVQYTPNWPRLLSMTGITSVIRHGERPSLLNDQQLDELRAREIDGFVRLPTLTSGQLVRIKSGVFSGKTGLFLGQGRNDRVKVLLSVLNRQMRVFVAEEAVEAAA